MPDDFPKRNPNSDGSVDGSEQEFEAPTDTGEKKLAVSLAWTEEDLRKAKIIAEISKIKQDMEFQKSLPALESGRIKAEFEKIKDDAKALVEDVRVKQGMESPKASDDDLEIERRKAEINKLKADAKVGWRDSAPIVAACINALAVVLGSIFLLQPQIDKLGKAQELLGQKSDEVKQALKDATAKADRTKKALDDSTSETKGTILLLRKEQEGVRRETARTLRRQKLSALFRDFYSVNFLGLVRVEAKLVVDKLIESSREFSESIIDPREFANDLEGVDLSLISTNPNMNYRIPLFWALIFAGSRQEASFNRFIKHMKELSGEQKPAYWDGPGHELLESAVGEFSEQYFGTFFEEFEKMLRRNTDFDSGLPLGGRFIDRLRKTRPSYCLYMAIRQAKRPNISVGPSIVQTSLSPGDDFFRNSQLQVFSALTLSIESGKPLLIDGKESRLVWFAGLFEGVHMVNGKQLASDPRFGPNYADSRNVYALFDPAKPESKRAYDKSLPLIKLVLAIDDASAKQLSERAVKKLISNEWLTMEDFWP